MKLITILTLVTTCSANELGLQQFNQPQYPFPLHFPPQQPGSFVTENNVYLPPDSHTAIPYFAQKNTNDLQYQYLPPTGTKAPSKYPPPFPMFSTTFRPNSEDDDDEEDDDDDREVFGSSTTAPFDRRFNQSQNSPGPQVEIPNRPIPKTMSYYNPIDRIDAKYPAQSLSGAMSSTPPPFNYQAAINRRMVQPAGFMGNPNQNDQMMADQMKTASHTSHQYIHPPQGYPGPTPEPVPILRLSNEMDLDGSYSYEALSGDQTHMMQHGHVENLGTDHAENVVEGSYSYVGDNGQTYTVHYIADGNGFRASGDHLPVPPPVPEIIQRSIEYNMAEESSKPHHLQSNFNDEEKRNNQMRNHHYQPTLPPPPPRNLFTGRQPEAFSHNNGATSSQSNHLQQAASTQTPVISHYEAPKESPPRMATAPISPQITFLASQGAHDPSQTIKRMFSPPSNEGPVFRFGNLRNKFEQSKPDVQRMAWQYQNPYLQDSVTKMTPNKNYISRSSMDQEDDVMINFSEMTPEQYSRMYNAQIKPGDKYDDNYDTKVVEQMPNSNNIQQQYNIGPQHNENHELLRELPVTFHQNEVVQNVQDLRNSNPITFPYPQNWYSNGEQNAARSTAYHPNMHSRAIDVNVQRSNLVTKDTFVPPSQIITTSYDTFRSDAHEARQLELSSNKTLAPLTEFASSTTPKNQVDESNFNQFNTTYYEIYKTEASPSAMIEQSTEDNRKYFTSPMPSTTESHIQKNHHVPSSSNDNIPEPNGYYRKQEPYSIRYDPKDTNQVTSTEENFSDVLKTNIFLKNVINKSNASPSNTSVAKEDSWRPSLIQSQPKKVDEKKEMKESKTFTPKLKTSNDFEESKRKSIDISQIANLVTLKNYFESNKIKPKPKSGSNSGMVRNSHDNYARSKLQEIQNKNFKEQKLPSHYNKENNSYKVQKSTDYNGNAYAASKPEDYDRMVGVAKIYKTLQRNSKLDGNGSPQMRSGLMPPVQEFSLHRPQPGLPPLGRAGPNMKSYLPPIFS